MTTPNIYLYEILYATDQNMNNDIMYQFIHLV